MAVNLAVAINFFTTPYYLEVKRLAGDNGIVLLDRHEICGLLMPLPAERMAER